MTTFSFRFNFYFGEIIFTSKDPVPDSRKHQSLFLSFLNYLIYVSVYVSIATFISFFRALIVRLYLHCTKHPEKRFFRGYEPIGKTVGSALMFGMYIRMEKSVKLMFLFLSLAYLSVCIPALLKPYTDFGVLHFLLIASLDLAWSLFGLRHVYLWIVLCVCILIPYKVEPTEQLTNQRSGSGHGRVSYVLEDAGAQRDALCKIEID